VTAAEERLMLPTQVRIRTGDGEILARGRVVGLDLTGGPPEVNRLHVFEGRGLQPGDDGRPVALLERSFAAYHGLPPDGRLLLAGGVEVDYVGHGVTPEFFYVLGDGLELFAQATYAVVFVPLSSAQTVIGAPMVNDLVLRLAPGVDPDEARDRLVDALAAELPEVSATVTTRSEDPAHHILYEDIEGDQKVWNVIAFLILAGGTLAAFNLATRVIEAQRREIGVSMAIGASPAVIALRPLLFGFQVGLLGVAGGVAVGFAAAAGMRRLLVALLAALPVWITDFQVDLFARAAVFGLLLPVLATAYPVWRALRVEPVEALRHVATRHGGASRMGTRMPLPGRTIDQIPVRNLLRNPRRTVLTVVAIGAALTTLVAIVGLLDTLGQTLDDYGEELAGDSPGRVTATLVGFQPVDGPAVTSIAARPEVAAVEASVQLPATAVSDVGEIGLLVDLVDPDHGLWSPTVIRGGPPSGDGIVLSAKAAADLGVGPGDPLVLRHPQRQGETAFTLVDTPITVAGIHPGPVRPTAYLHRAAAGSFGMAGLANVVQVAPVDGVGPDRLREELFDVTGVATVIPVTAVTDSLDEALDLFEGVLRPPGRARCGSARRSPPAPTGPAASPGRRPARTRPPRSGGGRGGGRGRPPGTPPRRRRRTG
jgi:putative ABC transport system permease protein